mmetsp:Transcript_41573/g.123411  ORF Transcript_41573/g.123411 Transcript_41573/m.123411 type:complete len:246 (+) Transcript_41573:224-961(+)
MLFRLSTRNAPQGESQDLGARQRRWRFAPGSADSEALLQESEGGAARPRPLSSVAAPPVSRSASAYEPNAASRILSESRPTFSSVARQRWPTRSVTALRCSLRVRSVTEAWRTAAASSEGQWPAMSSSWKHSTSDRWAETPATSARASGLAKSGAVRCSSRPVHSARSAPSQYTLQPRTLITATSASTKSLRVKLLRESQCSFCSRRPRCCQCFIARFTQVSAAIWWETGALAPAARPPGGAFQT